MADFSAEEPASEAPEESEADLGAEEPTAEAAEDSEYDVGGEEPGESGGGDAVPPVVTFLVPVGDIDPDETIGIEITDDVGATITLITVKYPALDLWDVAYDLDTGYAPQYLASQITPIAGGFRYDLIKPWHGAPTFHVHAIDAAGNATLATRTYTLAAVPAPTPEPSQPPDDPFAEATELRTAVVISLFSDRRAPDDAVLPAGDSDLRGWWGDQFATVEGDRIGSHLWLLDRSTSADNVALRAEEMAKAALAWLVEDHVASDVTVTVTVTKAAIILAITIERPEKDPVAFRFAHAWEAEAAAEPLPLLIM
jgi:phage gp46-like protein